MANGSHRGRAATAMAWTVAAALCLGFCGAGEARAETVIAALGDSLTQGYGLPEEQGFVPQMEDWLQAQGADVRMINAGVSGDTTAGGAARVDWTLAEDVDGMIVALGGNDLLRGLDPGQARANLEKIVIAARDAGVPVLLVGFEAPQNYGAEYKEAFDAIYPELSVTYGTLYAESFFIGLEEVAGEAGELRGYLQSDGLHPNAEAVKLIVAGLGPEVLDLVAAAED
ncbi:MAG: arylesterase [Marinibacterium profundimaris]